MNTSHEEDQPLDWSILQGRIISDLDLGPQELMEIERGLSPDVYTGERPVTGAEIKHALFLVGNFRARRPRLKQCA